MSLKPSKTLRPKKLKPHPKFKHYPARKLCPVCQGDHKEESCPLTVVDDDRRNYPEDADSTSGNYCHKCTGCGEHFTGHKHRSKCRRCARKERSEWPAFMVMLILALPAIALLVILAKHFWRH